MELATERGHQRQSRLRQTTPISCPPVRPKDYECQKKATSLKFQGPVGKGLPVWSMLR